MNTKPESRPGFERSMFVVCIMLTFGIGVLHYVVPKEISMFLLYLAPILLSAHFLPARAAYAIATLASVLWALAYIFGDHPTDVGVAAWNILVRVALFYSTTIYSHILISRASGETSAREEVERLNRAAYPLSGSHLACEECGRVNTIDRKWLPPLEFLRVQAHLDVHTCICPDCLAVVRSKKNSQSRDPM